MINAAPRLLERQVGKGVLPINLDTLQQLREKQPNTELLNEDYLLKAPINQVNPVIIDFIDGNLISRMSIKTKGAAGPQNFDLESWRIILGSKLFGTEGS